MSDLIAGLLWSAFLGFGAGVLATLLVLVALASAYPVETEVMHIEGRTCIVRGCGGGEAMTCWPTEVTP